MFCAAIFPIARCVLPVRRFRAQPRAIAKDCSTPPKPCVRSRRSYVILGGHSYGGRQATLTGGGDSRWSPMPSVAFLSVASAAQGGAAAHPALSATADAGVVYSRDARSLRLDRRDDCGARRHSGAAPSGRDRKSRSRVGRRGGGGYTARSRVLRERLNQVEERIHSAVERAGRRRSDDHPDRRHQEISRQR